MSIVYHISCKITVNSFDINMLGNNIIIILLSYIK